MLPLVVPAVVKSLPWKWIGIGLLVLGIGGYIGFLHIRIVLLERDVAVAEKALAGEKTDRAKLIATYQTESAKAAATVAKDNARVVNQLEGERRKLIEENNKLTGIAKQRSKVHTVIKERIIHADPTEDRPVGAILYRTLNDLRCLQSGQAGSSGDSNPGC